MTLCDYFFVLEADQSSFLLMAMVTPSPLETSSVLALASRVGSWVAGSSKEVATKFLNAALPFCFLSRQCLRLFPRRVSHCSYLAYTEVLDET